LQPGRVRIIFSGWEKGQLVEDRWKMEEFAEREPLTRAI
jgi:hypothetical protein